MLLNGGAIMFVVIFNKEVVTSYWYSYDVLNGFFELIPLSSKFKWSEGLYLWFAIWFNILKTLLWSWWTLFLISAIIALTLPLHWAFSWVYLLQSFSLSKSLIDQGIERFNVIFLLSNLQQLMIGLNKLFIRMNEETWNLEYYVHQYSGQHKFEILPTIRLYINKLNP